MVQPEHTATQATASPRLDPGPAVPPEGFDDFYRASYRAVVEAAMNAGANVEEARDAASKTYLEMLRIWPVQGNPLGYARKAAVHNFIKEKARLARLVIRLAERGHVPREGAEDDRLAALEGREWVAEVLSKLTTAQREVMQGIADGLDRDEIAQKLGISNDVLRRRLADARSRLVKILSPDGEFRNPGSPATGTSREEAR